MTLNRKILLGFAACTAVLIGVAIFSFKNNEKFIASSQWVEHTHEVMYEFEQILGYSVDAETGTRGFVITGNDKFLEPYENAKKLLFAHIDRAKELTKDNPTQQKNIGLLNKEINMHLSYFDRILNARRTDANKAFEIVGTGEGKRINDGIRKIVENARGLEEKLLVERKQANEADARNFNLIFMVLVLIIVIVLISVYIIINSNLKALKKAETETANKNWLLTGNDELNNKMQGDKDVNVLAADMISLIASYLKAQIGAIYLVQNERLSMVGGYAFDHSTAAATKIGEGVAGQAVFEKKPIVLNNLPADYLKINSGLGKTLPKALIAFPFTHSGQVKGVIEIASLNEFKDLDLQFLNLVSENIGIAFNSSESRTRLVELLEETQIQSEELQSQQEELKQLNEELEEQAQNLKQQQEELQQTNEELEEQTQALEMKNKDVEAARFDIEQKTKQLEVSGRYKSEFLANMSHELRTPLNSLLILSRDLADNKEKNLNADQVESAEIVNKSGKDLLNLINEVLDLSKIEAGKMDIRIERIVVKDFISDLQKNFKFMAAQKQLKLETEYSDSLTEVVHTDSQRLDQVLKNILSNAIKFTDKGKVTISVKNHDTNSIAISVRDTGIGIPEEKQMIVFEAFQQADGGTSRKYGGTGLGLSISRELMKLLGGEITLSSKMNEGSVFTLIIPIQMQAPVSTSTPLAHINEVKTKPITHAGFYNYPTIEDDSNTIEENDKLVLVIEDDLKFAEILRKQAHKKGFKFLSASTGEDGLVLADKYQPQAIILDIDLPGIDGHKVLIELKSNPLVRHIPVHIVSVNERTVDPIKSGAVEYFTKPIDKNQLDEAFSRIENFISRKMKNLLIVEDDDNSRKAIRKLIGNGDVKCFEAGTGKDAIKLLNENRIDCVVLDIGLPDINGFKLIQEFKKIKKDNLPPIIVYTGRELSREENDELQKYAETIIIKGVKSEERLLDETALFLHRTISNLPESKKLIITNLYDKEALLTGKKVLLVDDDMRNVFALSKVLKERGMEITKAENGKIALEKLEKETGIDIVLMDIMMPEMDGYEAMKRIRAQSKFQSLPVIALTAKAMKEDRQKCIDAGANDYITKPVDVERLLSLVRVWLSK